MWKALAAHPWIFASVTLGVAALNVAAPVAILSAVRKPVDYYTFNPWLKRLPEWLASDEATLGEKLAKLPDLALFWFSAKNCPPCAMTSTLPCASNEPRATAGS